MTAENSSHSTSDASLTFEQAMQQLEESVRRLEVGDLALGESIERYKRALQLVQFCRSQLDKAELEISKLMEVDGVVESSTTTAGTMDNQE